MNVTASLALKLIPDSLKSQPVFFCIDDTMISKFGRKFEDVSKLFDHAAHNGSNYLNGHCFVSLMLCVPIWSNRRIAYLAVPLGYRMWQKKQSKLELAAAMVRQVMPSFASQKNVIILCDSWYAKKNLACIVDEYPNLDLICNARADSVIYDLAPQPTGRRGRPAKHGERLSIKISCAVISISAALLYVSYHLPQLPCLDDFLLNTFRLGYIAKAPYLIAYCQKR